jgi:hypothetical protein
MMHAVSSHPSRNSAGKVLSCYNSEEVRERDSTIFEAACINKTFLSNKIQTLLFN